jgi:hypothetical protein
MWVAWFSPRDSLSRMTAHDASFETIDSIPNFLKYPSSCAMTIGAQSVSAMMPNRIVFVSGPSCAYAPPTHPAGSPLNSAPAAVTPAAFRNRRLD